MANTDSKSLYYSATAKAGLLLIAIVEFLISRSTKGKFFEPESFEWIKKIEKDFIPIKGELLNLLNKYGQIPELKNLSHEQARIVRGNKWKSFFLFAYGEKIEKNCSVCPATTRSIQNIPGVLTVFFSILEPHTRLTEHRGPYKGVLRYHLALLVPREYEKCGIRIEDEIRNWQEGKSMVFDDSFLHEAWNDSDEIRVVLFVDFERVLPFPLSVINKVVIYLLRKSPFIQKVVELIG